MASSQVDQESLKGLDLQNIFRVWEEKYQVPGFDPVPIIGRLSEVFESLTEMYLQKDPDPFDERHPSRIDPDCELGRMLKLLFRKDNFMTRLVNDYLKDNFFTRQNIQKSSFELNVAACRLILVIMPGLETSAVFQSDFDTLIHRLYSWATDSPEPLQSYATGLLAAVMEVQDIAIGFREQNAKLVPLMLKRLHTLQEQPKDTKLSSIVKPHNNLDNNEDNNENLDRISESNIDENMEENGTEMDVDDDQKSIENGIQLTNSVESPISSSKENSEENTPTKVTPTTSNTTTTASGSSQTQLENQNLNNSTSSSNNKSCLVRKMIPYHDPTIATSQMLILRYLTPMGEYQEFLVHVFEYNAMEIIFRYIENLNPKDTCLAFESLKYLAALLCHKKFCLEFINNGGLIRLLKVPRPSVAATGVSISLYYLAYCEDAMERICSMAKPIITDLVKYALWLLGCSHDSGRCHATMFFGLSFQFKIILDEFDNQDGLRKLYNVISVLPILAIGDDHNLNDDEECAERQIVRHVCLTLKKYMESHLYFKYIQVTRHNYATMLRACASNPEVISEQVRTLQELLPMRISWAPVDELLRLGGIVLLLRIIAFAYEWNYSGRANYSADTVRSILDIITICCVVPKVHHILCERIDLPEESQAAGFNVILGAAEGEIVIDVEVQKSALAVLIHCVCAPLTRPHTNSITPQNLARFSSNKKKVINKASEELLQKVWECVRSNNGIIVLLQLMQKKMPITDADCIRGMACRALAGLARSETVKQIMSKLPLFTSGQLQVLMRDPILQEKRADHVTFQKYALQLMERVSEWIIRHASLINIHKANVVAQTRIQFNDQQLQMLINEYLLSRGLNETAQTLQKEASLGSLGNQRSASSHSLFNFRSPTVVSRSRLKTKNCDLPTNSNTPSNSNTTTVPNALNQINGRCLNLDLDENAAASQNTPIKIVLYKKPNNTKNEKESLNNGKSTPLQKSLQKQISASDGFLSTTPTPRIEDKPKQNSVTLDTIITEYLTNQHALCKYPMSTCPQFDLLIPHKCPDPRPNRVYGLSTNFAGRFFKRQAGFNSTRLDRTLVHSNFSVVRTLRPSYSEMYFTCCAFSVCSSSVIVGSYEGDVKVFNINQSVEEFSTTAESHVNSIKCSRDGNLVLMSCAWRPFSSLYNIENRQFQMKIQWQDEEYCEFSNTVQDKVLGTKAEVATIYDINTSQKVHTFTPTTYNQYTRNRATFCPNDDLILSDGVLWDVRSGKYIHKFDKLNQAISGVFHPNGLEIVSNTEVWDLRTFHLLRTVEILDQYQVTFSPQNVMYGICPEVDSNDIGDLKYIYKSNFKTLDSYDYSSISTIDVKREIYDLAVNKTGSQIAVVENQYKGCESMQESVVRIYNVGRKKNAEDETEEEEEEMEGSDASISETDSLGASMERSNARRALLNVFEDDGMFSDSSVSTNSSSDDDENDNDNENDEDNDNDDNDDDDDDEDDAYNEYLDLMMFSHSDSSQSES